MTEQLDRFPKAGDSFTCDRYTVRVLEARGMRVEKVKVTLAPAEEPAAEPVEESTEEAAE